MALFGYPIFCYHKSIGFLWFRLFGYGIVFKDVKRHPLLFGERNGFTKYLKIRNLIIRFLKPNTH